MMRLPEMLAELEAERTQLDLAINALRLLADRTVVVPSTRIAPRAQRAPKTQPRTSRQGGADLATKAAGMKRAGSTAKEIAKTLGITPSVVYTLTKGVKRGKVAPVKPSGPRRRCGGCEQIGLADPCEHCGEAR